MKIFIKTLALFIFILCVMPACASMPSSELSGEKLVSGKNPKEIIFIHGMFVTPLCWREWEVYFKKVGYRVSSPAWPLHEGSVEELRQPGRLDPLGQLELSEVLDHYRKLLKTKTAKPILVGHSMGGLIAQILLSEGFAEAAVAIDSAPPKGVIALSWSFIKSNWGAVNPFASKDRPIELDQDQFSYAFLNAQAPEMRKTIYDEFYVPESRRVGKAPTSDVAKIDPSRARGPLLIIAGGADHIIPAKLNYKNFKFYRESASYTEFKLFEGRDHWTLAGPGWQEVASYVDSWLRDRFVASSENKQ